VEISAKIAEINEKIRKIQYFKRNDFVIVLIKVEFRISIYEMGEN